MRSPQIPKVRSFSRLTSRALACLALGLGLVPTVSNTSADAAAAHGPVDVLYAGSLEQAIGDQVGPAFQKATGYTFVGTANGSSTLASEIKGELVKADVFLSASVAVDKTLMGKANGNWVTKYTVFGTSTLVLGYNPKSRFASQLKTKPWWEVVSEPGFRLGRTDPATDPKGVLADEALEGAATKYNMPALKTLATETSDVFPEDSLVGRVQAGELDAGFFYAIEAKAANILTVPLTGYSYLHATYTVAVLTGAPHPAAAASFVSYLLGPAAGHILRTDGLTLP